MEYIERCVFYLNLVLESKCPFSFPQCVILALLLSVLGCLSVCPIPQLLEPCRSQKEKWKRARGMNAAAAAVKCTAA